MKPYGGCRLCIVEIEGMPKPVTSCTTPATEGMIVTTESDRLYMPVSSTDARLHPKRVIYGMEIGDRAVAVDAGWLAQTGHWSNDYEGQKLSLRLRASGEVDASLDGEQITIHRMYWFAWYTFHPSTALIDGKDL